MPSVRGRRPRRLSPEERKSLTHGDFWIPEEEREVYRRALQALNDASVPYVVAGAYAIYEHTGIYRQTKDLDLFVEPSAVIPAARALHDAGFVMRLEDLHWLAKAFVGDKFVDLIYGMGNGVAFIDEQWSGTAEARRAGRAAGAHRARRRAHLASAVHQRAPPPRHVGRRALAALQSATTLDWERLVDARRSALAAAPRPAADVQLRLSGISQQRAVVGDGAVDRAGTGRHRARRRGRGRHPRAR